MLFKHVTTSSCHYSQYGKSVGLHSKVSAILTVRLKHVDS